ncbi:NAD(P)/FAD-dependent oxidoreductase [Tessaracoccus sp. OS52]|uniref:phytoene desaturase family protein n=1 Tax=Tessaracoccus sp. OS52 TaxID=2886691 RepID=UPI001D0FC3C5|nr:NAD(P)/FAD-dependent oxidoreductase [Tessaracoccus sp. OS52]MCC2591895.1 NAD(P)/FAD-dependent oxidoreductase [Tessaracoccus sp. OS52]
MSPRTVDAVVIGAGHHGLVAAALLADAGWDVLVLEGRAKPGGAVASRTIDGFVVDDFSSCYPLGKASPVLQSLELDEHGLVWADRRPAVVHVADAADGVGTVVEATPEATATALEADHEGDGEAWLKLTSGWHRVKEPLLDALLQGWPPVGAGARLARVLGAAGLLDFARFALLPSDRMGQEWFGGSRGPDILAGNAAHADVSPLAPVSGLLGFLMSMMAQEVGFPVPRGGAASLAEALASRARTAGAILEFDSPVASIIVSDGRAGGVALADGTEVRARRAVIADVSAPALYEELLPSYAVPAGLRARMDRFLWDPPTLKLNLQLAGPMPWRAARAREAAVVHAGLSARGLVGWHADIATGRVPERAFALVGQMTTADPTRSPAGTESLWAYTHLPKVADEVAVEASGASLASIEAMFDDLAPGWRDLEQGRWVQTPQDLAGANPSLVDGALGAGTSQLFQQGPWRPVSGLGGPITHVQGLYLASAATHPGGGVHGGAGFSAARAALRDSRWWSRPFGVAASKAQELLQRREPDF